MSNSPDVEEVVRKLSPTMIEILLACPKARFDSDNYRLPRHMNDRTAQALSARGLVSYHSRILTPLGLQVRAHLERQSQ